MSAIALGLSRLSTTLVQPAFAIWLAWMLYSVIKWAYLRKAMPPGPLGLPWFGNKHQLPLIKPWRRFAEWNKEYGSVVSFFLGSTPVIVLGKAQAAWDLLEKRSEYYSSRPRFIVGGEILSSNMRGLMLPNNEFWRKWRKILHIGFHSHKVRDYHEIQSLESKVTMHDILRDPKDYERHLQRFAASVVTSVTYGRRVDSVHEWIVKENMDSMDYLTSVNIPGKFLVETWPWLLKLPRSLQWFRREPEERRQRDIIYLMHLLNDVKARMKTGSVPDCLTSQAISNIHEIGMNEIELAYSVSSPFGAGIETTAGTLMVFILAILHFPAVMKTAQDELDRVVGPDRMPEFGDKDSLPYIIATVHETLRWRPVPALGGSPHAVTVDDEYHGMFIPKGSTVFANSYAIMHDPEMFPSPELFRPERFLETKHPRLQTFDLPFGFGRRICPGMHLALNSLFINIARLLWAFEFRPVVDETGKEIIPDIWAFTNGFNSRPLSFNCQIIPRSDKVVACIDDEFIAIQPRLASWKQ